MVLVYGILLCHTIISYLHLELALVSSQQPRHRPDHVHGRHGAAESAAVERLKGRPRSHVLALLSGVDVLRVVARACSVRIFHCSFCGLHQGGNGWEIG